MVFFKIPNVPFETQDMMKDIRNITGTTHTILGLVAQAKYSVKTATMNIDRTGPFTKPVVKISGEAGKLSYKTPHYNKDITKAASIQCQANCS